MISDTSRYYGCVFHQMMERFEGGVHVRAVQSDVAGFYVVNWKLPVYVKYSTARKGPWSFSFQSAHQDMQAGLVGEYGECVTVLVCGRDGIVAVPYVDMIGVIGCCSSAQVGVTVYRRHNQMYQVKGRDGVLERRVSKNSLGEILASCCRV